MKEKIQRLLKRLIEVEELLAQSETLSDKETYRKLTQEYSYLTEIRDVWKIYDKADTQLQDDKRILVEETDEELIGIVKEEISSLEKTVAEQQKILENLLVPPDPNDSLNTIVEIRAGTGGDEAAIFVGDVVRMYKNYASSKGWTVEVLSSTPSDMGGFKEYVMVLSGKNVHRQMQYEAGTHRVQRVPETETQGRVHTSAITVAVLVEPPEEEKVKLNEDDLRIDTYRASGAGGQHVNVTDSAVRITHIPSGTVVACQDERSQLKNKEKAMRILVAKIAETQKMQKAKEQADIRMGQVGTGDRSGRIRTYNFPQNRLTDHRIDLTLYKLDYVIEGDLDEITNPLVAHFYQLQLSE